jgi:flagellar motor component MotA
MSGIGHGLAVALLATLYGVVTARLLYLPAATKIMQKQDNLRFRNHLITEGMAMIVANKSPRYIQDKLNSFLKPGLMNRVASEPSPVTAPPAEGKSPTATTAAAAAAAAGPTATGPVATKNV